MVHCTGTQGLMRIITVFFQSNSQWCRQGSAGIPWVEHRRLRQLYWSSLVIFWNGTSKSLGTHRFGCWKIFLGSFFLSTYEDSSRDLHYRDHDVPSSSLRRWWTGPSDWSSLYNTDARLRHQQYSCALAIQPKVCPSLSCLRIARETDSPETRMKPAAGQKGRETNADEQIF